MSLPGISIVIPVSSAEYILYLRNCLASIEAQQDVNKLIDVLLVYTYNGELVSCIEEADLFMDICDEFSSVFTTDIVFYKHELSDYPLALARNIGARHSTRRIIGFIDADLVLDPRIFKKTLEIVPSLGKGTCVNVYRMPFGPKSPIYKELDEIRFINNLVIGRRDNAGKGGCLFIERDIFFRIRGYDERLYGWGYEDDDLYSRLEKFQVRIINLTSYKIHAMHQLHKHKKNYRDRYETNKKTSIFYDGVVRNPDGWGGESI
jgi:glycosyltransferase involved in cell wall biosynthesis